MLWRWNSLRYFESESRDRKSLVPVFLIEIKDKTPSELTSLVSEASRTALSPRSEEWTLHESPISKLTDLLGNITHNRILSSHKFSFLLHMTSVSRLSEGISKAFWKSKNGLEQGRMPGQISVSGEGFSEGLGACVMKPK